MTKQYKISRRVLNTKRHCTAYIIGGRTVSVPKAAQLAKRGLLPNVVKNGRHIQSRPNTRRLSDLTATVRR